MVRTVLLALACASVAGCAQNGGASKADYIGLADLRPPEETAEPADAGNSSDALRYVQSNRVLGAMAFQKATGRSVDPESLSNR